jgi:hypothetical protein
MDVWLALSALVVIVAITALVLRRHTVALWRRARLIRPPNVLPFAVELNIRLDVEPRVGREG